MPDEHSEGILNRTHPSPSHMSDTRLLVWIVVIAAAYFGIARLSLLLAFQHTAVSPLWPPAGIAFTAVLLLGYRVGAGIFIGAFAVNVLTLSKSGFAAGSATLAAFSMAAGNTLESLIGVYLVRHFTTGHKIFRDVKNTFFFIVFGALAGTAVAAFIGVTAVSTVAGTWPDYWHAWFTWLLGDATGIILVSPLLLSWGKPRFREWRLARTGEAALALVLLCAVSALIYVYGLPIKVLTIPVLLFIILRFGLFETSLSLIIFTCFAVFGTIGDFGDSLGTGPESLLLVQSYIGVIAITALFLSVVVGEKKRSVEAVKAEKAFSDTVINSVPGAFYVLDREGKLVRWNRFLEELNGVPSENLTGMSSLQNIYQDDQERVLTKIREAFETGESEAEARINIRGRTRDFIFTGRRVDVAGTGYVVGTGIDITERKSAEQELDQYRIMLEAKVTERTRELTDLNAVLASEIDERRSIQKILSESEANYRNLVEGANSVILRWAVDGTIIFLNRFGKDFFGYADEEIIGRNIVGTIVPETESTGRDLSRLVADIPHDPQGYVFNENENVRKNGERVWVSWTNKSIMDSSDSIVEILSVGNDITRRKLAEDRLKITLEELAKAKERAEAADRLKSAFLATMSHELRTPLNSIIGFTGIILGGYVGPLNEEQTKQLGMVRNSANHLLSLINDVLDISKIEAGQLKVSVEPFNLKELIDHVGQSSRPALESKKLTFSAAVPGSIGVVQSDKRRVEQILLNLISNAVKFTEQGGVSVECSGDNGSIKVSVTDSGMGIKEEDVDKLFHAFQQVDSGITRKFEGTGLGLYICKKLLDLLGGKIWVTSTWGRGSTFSFTLPVKSEVQ